MRIVIKSLAFSIISLLGSNAAAEVTTAQLSVVAKATSYVSVNRAQAALSARDVVQASSVLSGPDGTQHVRYQRAVGGLPVIGGDFIVHMPVTGKQRITSSMTATERPISLAPRINVAAAVSTASSTFALELATAPSSRLVLLAIDVPAPVLAHEVTLSGNGSEGPKSTTYYIDAQTGKVLLSLENLRTQRQLPSVQKPAVGIGITQNLGTVPLSTITAGGGYRLLDPTRGNGEVLDARTRGTTSKELYFAVPLFDADNVWGKGTDNDVVTAAADAYYGIAATWDYYKEVHGRHGIWNNGNGVRSYVNVGVKFANASWDGKSMYFGMGDGGKYKSMTALDVAGHEMSHGVVGATAGLVYTGESGSLDEATADIFGTMVERHAYAKLGRAFNWTIGESIVGPGKALRFLFKPSLDAFTSSAGELVSSADCYSNTIKNQDVHRGSGVGNHFFYLLSEGSVPPAEYASKLTSNDLVCNNAAVKGIGADTAEKIWYLALSAYFTSRTDYRGARIATLQAAADLYGQGSPQRQAVAEAWDAVLVP